MYEQFEKVKLFYKIICNYRIYLSFRVLSVATHRDELFILEGERSLIRVSYKPEEFPGI